MEELARRPDIKVADLITLAREQASVQQQLESLTQEAAQQKRRIDTNLLTLHFSDANADSVWREFRQSLGKLLGNLLEGTANALVALAYGLPFLLLFFPVLLLWRWAWRRVVGRKKAAP
jgi:ABC-type transporter Mla subunit MlaD